MKGQISYKEDTYSFDLSEPLDISIAVGQVKCFYATDFKAHPYVSGDFIGAVKEGAPVNFFDVQMNPHGNGTHTECLGHITKQQEQLPDLLKQYHFIAQLISVDFTKTDTRDKVISLENIKAACPAKLPEALVIRTLPNDHAKCTKDYSGTNPPYLDAEAMRFLVKHEVKHLLLDLPSVDREEDEGLLAAHHIFWQVQTDEADQASRSDCTITELIYVPDAINDGLYLLNIQVPTIPLDAVPSKPVLYKLSKTTDNK